jgi:hypothetical protein
MDDAVWIHLAQNRHKGFCEDDNEPSSSIKCGDIFTG